MSKLQAQEGRKRPNDQGEKHSGEATYTDERVAKPNRVGVAAPPRETRAKTAIEKGPIRTPPRRIIRICCSSMLLRAIRDGRYRHATGNANIVVTRKIGKIDPAPPKSRLRIRLKRRTATGKELNQSPLRPRAPINLCPSGLGTRISDQ